MTCISPPEPNETELLTYLDGEASPRVVAHIEQCAYCHQRASRLHRLQEQLSIRLFRATCPAPERLGEYHLGLLPPAQTETVAQHLQECPHCTREVAQLEAYMSDLAPALAPNRLEQAKEWVRVRIARLVEGGVDTGSLLAPIPAGIRGEETGPHVYEAGDIEVMLEVQEDAERPDRRVILGLVTGLGDPETLQIHVWRADELHTTLPVDELGNFVISGLAPATYELIVSGPETEVHIQDFAVNDEDA